MVEETSEFKVLLVDDRDENLFALETILKDENYHLVKANSGKQALAYLLKDLDFHLIIMDVLMPGMNGFETAALIYEREKLKNIPIIFLTAMDIEGNIYKGYKAGAVDYISKPIIAELLKVKVRAFVELSEKNRQLVRQEKMLRAANRKLEWEITERKLSEAKIKALNEDLAKKLEQLQSLDSFNYSISHDLMSPLNSITGLAGLLQTMYPEKFDDEVLEIVNHIMGSVDRMSNLIKDLLSFSRQANAEISKVDVSMRALVDDVMEEVSKTMPVTNVEIVVHELPNAYCDNSMLKQVWINLVSNAIKYSQKTPVPKVEIGGKHENGDLIYFVKDNGAGFNMAHYNKLFSIFQRLHSESEFNGTGIGLAVVKRIIERHDGRIWAQSEVGKGSEFYFTLKAKENLLE
ncbi:response regulator [Chryseolinea sp. H1M3-3]|uniref:sensor histidine kinase n=1 Tax=Chryseolinea sp. H1M3-3 TaxID=3034144 RepID=UPI0023EB354A|nr:response regulator [Chryseolinea sp. H1M3-3]